MRTWFFLAFRFLRFMTGFFIALAVHAQSISTVAPPLTPPPSPMRQVIYAPFAGMEEFGRWEVEVANRGNRDIPATVRVYGVDGKVVASKDIVVPGNKIQRIDIRRLVAAASVDKLGGIAVEFTAGSPMVAAQVTLTGFHSTRDRTAIDRFGNIDAILTSDGPSNTADAVWWEPEDGRSFLILGNASADPIQAQFTLGSGSKQTVNIAPNATVIQPVPHSGAKIQSVHVVSGGKAGALRVTGYTVSERDGFVNVIRAYDPAGSSEAAVRANALHFSGASNHLVVKNLTQSPINVWGTIYPARADASVTDVSARMPEGPTPQTVAIAPRALQPGGVAELDLPDADESLDGAALKVESSGAKGSIVASYVSHDRNRQMTRSMPFKDIADWANNTGGYPWRLDGNYESKTYITNVSKARAAFGALIFPEGSERYQIDTQYLEPGETTVIDFRKLRDEQIADRNGVKLAKDVDSGEVHWFPLSAGATHSFIGRTEVLDRLSRVVSSFSCGGGCPCSPYSSAVLFGPSSVTLPVGGTASIATTLFMNDPCQQNDIPHFNFDPVSWSAPSFISLTTGHSPSTLTALSAGSGSYLTSTSTDVYIYNPLQAPQCSFDHTDLVNGSGSVNVVSVAFGNTPVVPLGGTGGISATVTPSNNTTAITLTLSTTSGTGQALFLNGTSSMTITQSTTLSIAGAQASSIPNNISLTATIRADGKTITVGSTSFTVDATHGAIPVNFRQISVTQLSNAVLKFNYLWDSSSGNLSDLGQCQVEEFVTYPGYVPGVQGHYFWASPPYAASSSANPETGATPVSATLGSPGLQDLQGNVGFLKPYVSNDVTSNQVFQFECPYYKGGQLIPLFPHSGTIAIHRVVSQNTNGTWQYTITKSGSSNSSVLP